MCSNATEYVTFLEITEMIEHYNQSVSLEIRLLG